MKYLCIFDLDETLLSPDKSISPENLKALADLRNLDIGIVVATARSPFFTGKIIDILSVTLPIIACNGGILISTDFKDVIWENPIDKAQLSKLFSVIAICQYTTLPYGDGSGYYAWLAKDMNTFAYSFKSLLLDFRLYSHAAQGIILFAGVGNMLAGWFGVYIVQTVLILLAMMCVYGILGRIFANISELEKVFGVAMFAFNPYILGFTSHFNPDMYNTLFLIYAIYFFLREWDYLVSFSLVLIYLSKETGLLIIGGFIIWTLCMRIWKMEGGSLLSRAVRYLWPKKLILYILPELMLLIPGIWYYPGYSMSTGDTSINNFGFSLSNITTHFNQSFLYNFHWLYLLLLFAAIAAAFFRTIKKRKKIDSIFADPDAFKGVLFGFTIFLIFIIFLFVSTPCPRYSEPLTLLGSIAGVALIKYIWENRKITTAIMLIVVSLFTLQCYYSADPSMKQNYSLDLGNQKIYGPTKSVMAADCNLTLLNEMYAYNRLSTYADSLLTEAVRQINPTKDTVFYACGLDLDEIYSAGRLYWNPKTRQFDADSSTDNFSLTIKILDEYALMSDSPMSFDSDFYVILPARKDNNALKSVLFNGEIIEKNHKWPNRFVEKGCKIKEYYTVEDWAGYLAVYRYEY